MILITATLAAVLVFWVRTRPVNRLTELEALVAQNEPYDHVHTIVGGPGDTLYVGTHLGVVTGKGSGKWNRPSGPQPDVMALAPAGADALYVAGPEIGVSRLAGGDLQPLLQGAVPALAADPQNPNRLIIFKQGTGLAESRDGGKTWHPLTDVGSARVYAVAIHPRESGIIVAGGEKGFLAVTTDGGKNWTFPTTLQRSISALAFDPQAPGRLWAAAGGAVYLSEKQGAAWRAVSSREAAGRTVVSLTFPTGSPGGGPLAVTPEGYLFRISP